MTIGQMINQHTPKRKKNSPKTVHLVGTDRPEATMIYAGFYHEILAANPLNPIKLTLVSQRIFRSLLSSKKIYLCEE